MEWIEKNAKVKKEKIYALLPNFEQFGDLGATLSIVPIIGDIVILTMAFFCISPFLAILFMTIGKLARYLSVIGLLKKSDVSLKLFQL